ncbi:fused MFS/spermidine synthase [Acaricomes phytoseiuli]|uniref:spermidine synthase n=1 Tax=Acaricomes phytoseiuli TaxID=291968 RepID=UPI00222231D7|nr:fused MFS/spermidine synthase [Acaricomes phytoseiuli]MCW1250570.1 fused MFS/spermidine synthase [Acaricomes phytoseiuli]
MPGRRAPEPRAGEHSIETGVAELQQEPGSPDSWLLTINGMQSSHIDLSDPLRLEFEYMRWMASLILDRWPERNTRLRVLHLGGGACALARYLVATYPDSRNTVVEIDATLAALVRDWFGLPQAPLLKIRVGEAREVTEQLSAGSRDVVIRDVFSGRFTPPPLLTAEFTEQAKRVLSESGIYLLNCGDAPSLRHARREAATMAAAFQHTAIIADPPMLKGRRYGNIVMAGSAAPLARGTWLARELLSGAMPATIWDDAAVRRFAAGQEPYRD